MPCMSPSTEHPCSSTVANYTPGATLDLSLIGGPPRPVSRVSPAAVAPKLMLMRSRRVQLGCPTLLNFWHSGTYLWPRLGPYEEAPQLQLLAYFRRYHPQSFAANLFSPLLCAPFPPTFQLRRRRFRHQVVHPVTKAPSLIRTSTTRPGS